MEQIRQIPGVTVAHTHTIGKGFPDLVISHRGKNYLLEVKDPSQPPSKRKLTDDEKVFHQTWTGQISVVETLQDVLEVIKK